MADTHDHLTRKVKATDLDATMTLVGQSGGLSSIYEVHQAPSVDVVALLTEHGALWLRATNESGTPTEVDVLDLDGEEGPAEAAERDAQVLATLSGPRPLWKIAREIEADWTNVYFGAVPYLKAMRDLTTLDDRYGMDDGETIVTYFISNAPTWRGEAARRIKAELRTMLAEHHKARK